jgi:hypothetical protein
MEVKAPSKNARVVKIPLAISHTSRRGFIIAAAADNVGRLAGWRVRANLNAGNEHELRQGPDESNDSGKDDDSSCGELLKKRREKQRADVLARLQHCKTQKSANWLVIKIAASIDSR